MQMNSLHSSCLLRRFLWSRHHFKDFIAVMVSQRNPTAQFLPRDGETCRRQKPVRFYWITARVCLIKHEEQNDRTVCGWVIFVIGRVHWLIVGSAEKLHCRKETSWLDSWVQLSPPTWTTHQSDSSDETTIIYGVGLSLCLVSFLPVLLNTFWTPLLAPVACGPHKQVKWFVRESRLKRISTLLNSDWDDPRTRSATHLISLSFLCMSQGRAG